MHPTNTYNPLPISLSASNIAGLVKMIGGIKDSIGGDTQRLMLRDYSKRPGELKLALEIVPPDRRHIH